MPTAYEGTDIIMSEANNKVLPAGQVLISYLPQANISLSFKRNSPAVPDCFVSQNKNYLLFNKSDNLIKV